LRHGGFVDHQFEAFQMATHHGRHRQHMSQIGRTVLGWRSTHCDEQNIAMLYGINSIACKTYTAIGLIFVQQGFEAWFKNGHITLLQGADFFSILVQANHLETQVRETRSCNQTYITRTNDCDAHFYFSYECMIHSQHET
jgi:hypothetical protein